MTFRVTQRWRDYPLLSGSVEEYEPIAASIRNALEPSASPFGRVRFLQYPVARGATSWAMGDATSARRRPILHPKLVLVHGDELVVARHDALRPVRAAARPADE